MSITTSTSRSNASRSRADGVKGIDTLEEQFRAELINALRRATHGRCPTIFSFDERRPRSTALRLRTKAERIMELRQTYSVDQSIPAPAARYLHACAAWQHGPLRHDTRTVAKNLLSDLVPSRDRSI